MSDPAVSLAGVGKMYKVFRSRGGIVLDAIGLSRPGSYREFWALREFDLALRPGERIGLIGRNGAGKSTVLRLLTGRTHPTEGTIDVGGRVNALLDTTGGLHPEFSGYENVRAALESMGYEDDRIGDATRDIAEFTELGRFLDQPFKTYSLGMQSRLAFAVATAVEPEILVVDEMLGAGDAYFFAKALERMEGLISGGAAVLIVSHALDQIIRFCDEAIWLDRGRIVMRAESTEVVRAYERFTRELEDRRLRARNRKVLAGYDAFEREGHTDQLDVALTPDGGPVEVANLRLLRDGDVEEELRVGDAQDADESQSAFVDLSTGGWAREEHGDTGYLRRVSPPDTAHALFALWFFYPTSRYELEVTYRAPAGSVRLRIERAGRAAAERELPAAPDWHTETLAFGAAGAVRATDGDSAPAQPVRWPGEGSLRIEDVTLHGEGGREQAVFPVGTPLTVRMTVRAAEAGRYPVTPAVSVYRTDGILVSNHPGEEAEVALAEGEEATWELAFGPLNLGDGRYVLTPAIYRRLTHVGESPFYDLLDRSHTFEVVGNAPFALGVFQHPARWRPASASDAAAAAAPAVAEERA